MRSAAFGRIGAVLLASAVCLEAAPSGPESVRLRAVSIEIQHLGSTTFALMTRELEGLLADAGITLDWRRNRPAGQTARDEPRTAFLDTTGRETHGDRPILAVTDSQGRAPTVWVCAARVAEVLNLRAHRSLESLMAQRSLGIVLGRVLAHELVHLLVPNQPHDEGAMRARVRFVALERPWPGFDRPLSVALGNAARSWRARGGPAAEEARVPPTRLAGAGR